jgi:hypothetical protein
MVADIGYRDKVLKRGLARLAVIAPSHKQAFTSTYFRSDIVQKIDAFLYNIDGVVLLETDHVRYIEAGRATDLPANEISNPLSVRLSAYMLERMTTREGELSLLSMIM